MQPFNDSAREVMKPMLFAVALCVALVAMLCTALPARAQSAWSALRIAHPRWLVGPVAGYTDNTHTIGYPMFAGDGAPLLAPPKGRSWELGGSAEYVIDERLGVMGNLLWTDRPGASRQTLRKSIAWLDDSTGSHTMTAENDIRYALLQAELLGTWRFAKFGDRVDVGLAFGPVAGVVVGDNIRQTVDLGYSRPPQEGVVTEDSGRVAILHDGPIPYLLDYRLSLAAGLFAEIRLDDISLMPGAYYDFGLWSISSRGDWNLTAIDLRLAVLWRM